MTCLVGQQYRRWLVGLLAMTKRYSFTNDFSYGILTHTEPPYSQSPKLKVSKFQKQIFLFSFEPKNEWNHFLISALASKNGLNQKNEGTLLH